MFLQIPALKVKDHIKMIVFVIWAAYGVIPTCHWYFEMGGSESQMVQVIISHHTNKSGEGRNVNEPSTLFDAQGVI